MIKRLSKYIPYIIFIVILIYFGIKAYKRIVYDNEIKKTGKYCIALIVGKMESKGSVGYIKYKYIYSQKAFIFEYGVDDSFYEQHKLGDTIIIRVLRSDPSQSLIIETLKYDSSFGKQPSKGWEKVPKKIKNMNN